MFYYILDTIQQFLYQGTVSESSYEYWLAVCLAGISVILLLYVPFAVVRWFFRGLAR